MIPLTHKRDKSGTVGLRGGTHLQTFGDSSAIHRLVLKWHKSRRSTQGWLPRRTARITSQANTRRPAYVECIASYQHHRKPPRLKIVALYVRE